MIQLLLIAFFAFVLVHLVLRFARGFRATVSDEKGGKAVHVETPLGGFDLKPQEKLDPALAGMLVYPGATPAPTQPPEYEADVHFFGREFHVLVATYSTSSSAEVVWEFYRRELPDWQEERQGYGKALVQKTADGKRKIRVYNLNGSTLIETGVSIKHKAEAASTAEGSSATRFGILR